MTRNDHLLACVIGPDVLDIDLPITQGRWLILCVRCMVNPKEILIAHGDWL